MTIGIVLAVIAVISGVIVLGVVLAGQGLPGSDVTRRDDLEGEGPTGEDYLPGSRPAGPGAEAMSLEPSEQMDEDEDR